MPPLPAGPPRALRWSLLPGTQSSRERGAGARASKQVGARETTPEWAGRWAWVLTRRPRLPCGERNRITELPFGSHSVWSAHPSRRGAQALRPKRRRGEVPPGRGGCKGPASPVKCLPVVAGARGREPPAPFGCIPGRVSLTLPE